MASPEYKTFAKIVPSFEKVLLTKEPTAEEYSSTMLSNEQLNFQLVFKNEIPWATRNNRIEVAGDLAPFVSLRSVEQVAVSYTAPEADDYYIGKEPGLYPDLLKPFGGLGVVLPCRQWKAVWVSVRGGEDGLPAGLHTLAFKLFDEAGKELAALSYSVEVLPVFAEKNDLKLTTWMHYDGICRHYGVKPFTKKFYTVFEYFLKAYVDLGMNMLLTPLFTPPLDTAMGHERLTAQLVGVEVVDGGYRFDFSKLEEFVRFAQAHGIRYFEFSHLFTQWGGRFCPKIMAKKNGRTQKIFGWHVSSASTEYAAFLDAFLPALYEEILKLGIKERSYMHLTDEPGPASAETYEKCCALVKRHMGGIPTMDALSEPVFCEKGIVDIPVPITKHYAKFLPFKKKELIVYYCCFPNNDYYSNRFINMPGVRTRILGAQLYATGATGFLHWGFNFYSSVLSLEEIDPYAVTDACGFFPGGDGYLVYPARTGVNYSIRAELTREAWQDYCALKTLEKLAGKGASDKLIGEAGIKDYNEYPKESAAFAAFRNKIYAKIKESLKK
ncbi:MAG: DUF4091 domain-containing protein [Clostridia bacterium]|nr:DUF4091 domain-containing protein [Clostridia bacterium]